MLYILLIVIALLILIPVYIVVASRKVQEAKNKQEWEDAQSYTTLRIDVPKNNEKAPLSAEQMFASIHGIYSESQTYQNHLSFEIVSKDKYIQFYVHIPKHVRDFVEGQIYAQYPTVEIREVPDYIEGHNPKTAQFAICELNLNKPDVYPIKFFDSFDVDPLSGITSVMGKLSPDESVWFQLLIKPVGDEWQEKGNSIVSAVRAGKKPGGQALLDSFVGGFKNFLKMIILQAIKPGEDISVEKAEVKLPSTVEEALKGIEQKITKLGFQTKIRILSISNDPISAKVKCQSIAAAFKQFNTTHLNGFRIGEVLQNDVTEWDKFEKRAFSDEGNIFNITELASIYHLPHQSVETPNIVWSGSKKGEPPANLPLSENTPQSELTVIGETTFRNVHKEFGIKKDDRRRHVYIIGKSGVGKSVLIENMAIDDVYENRGVIAIDPHGDLADKILSIIPDHRMNDVIVFDPADRAFPIAFNLLERVEDDFKGMVASGFVGIFKKIFGDSWGPRLEHILRNTVLALLDFPDSTMLDIPKMLTDNRFRDKVIEKVKDPVIRDFWVNEFSQYDAKFRTEAVSPILNKVGQFLSTATIRNIVGQPHSTINIREIMDQEKIMVVNLSRGKIGEDNSALLGAMMVTKIQLAAMSRADVTVDKRPDSYLYVDEFQNFATESFAVILAEARKYNLNLTVANQYIAQLPEPVRDAVFGNAGTILSFRVGGADADYLVKEFEPVFDTNDLVNLDKYNIYLKLLVDGVSAPAFSARTLPPVQKLTGNVEKIIELSRQKYSNPREVVEEEIVKKSKIEENELKAEAEAFRKGGLEALLVKNEPKQYSNRSQVPEKTVAEEKNEKVGEENKSSEPPEEKPTPTENKADKSDKPRVLKFQNIIGDKIYKEQTARGGVKWYIGEDIDLDKYKELGIEVPNEALTMMEKSKKVLVNNQISKPEIEHKEIPKPTEIEEEKKSETSGTDQGSQDKKNHEKHTSKDANHLNEGEEVKVTE